MMIYYAARTEDYSDNCWGQNTSMVFYAASEETAAIIAKQYLVNGNRTAGIGEDPRDVTIADVAIIHIGYSKDNVKEGTILLSGPGS